MSFLFCAASNGRHASIKVNREAHPVDFNSHHVMTAAGIALTTILNSPLRGRAGERLGQVRDVVARFTETSYPLVSGLILRIAGREVFVPIQDIAALEPGAVRLSMDRLDLRSFERRTGEILLARDVRGHHVISVSDAQLVRVKDIELSMQESELRVTGIYGGSGGVLERLHLPFGASRSLSFLDWSDIEPLLGHVPTVRRRLPFTRLARLHPAELADMVEAASPSEGEEIMQAVGEDRDLEADVFEELDAEYQVELLQTRTDAEAADILANMSSDDVADLVLTLEPDRRDSILGRLPLVQLRKVRMLLGYHPETAGGLMSPDFLALPPQTAIGAVVDAVRTSQLPPNAVGTVYVIDETHQLIGAVLVIELLRQDPIQAVGDVAERDPVAVRPSADIPEIALKMADFNLEALPVIDEADRLIGAIAVDDLLEVMLPAEWRAIVQRHPGPDRKRRPSPPSNGP
jgi:CBS domain-containing protein